MRACLIVFALIISVNNAYWLYWALAGGVESVGLAPDGFWESIIVCFLSVSSFAMSLGSLGFLIDRFAPPKKSNLIRCPDCKRTLSRSAATCPHCGCPIVSIPGTAAAKSEGKDGSPFTPDSVEDAWRRVLGYSAFPFIIWGISFILVTRPEKTLQHTAGVASVAFGPDGKTLVTSGNGGKICLWEVDTGRLIGFATHVDSLGGPAVAFAPDGKGFWSCDGNSLEFWNVDMAKTFLEQNRPDGNNPGFLVSGLPARRLTSTTTMSAFALSPSGDFALAATDQGAIRWDLQDCKTSFFFLHGASVTSLAWHPNEMTIATGSHDNAIRLWDSNLMGFVNRDRLVKDSFLSLNVPGRVRALAFRPDGKSIATGGDDRIVRLWNFPTGNPQGSVLEHPEEVTAVAFSPDGTLILTACGNFEKRRGEARLWNAASGKQLGRFRHKHLVTCLAFSPEGEEFVTGSEDKSVKLWKVPKTNGN